MIKTVPIAKGLIIDAESNVLILRRSQSHPTLAGQVDLPGGQIDAGEEPGAALIREVAEETGLQINFEQLALQYAGTNLSGEIFRVRLWYIVRLETAKPEITISWEHESAAWLPLAELTKLQSEFHGFYRDALDHATQHNLLNN